MGRIKGKDQVRFNQYCEFNPGNGCIEWNGNIRQGYGRFYLNGKWLTAHRVAWEIHNGPISEGMLILHKCDNSTCVNIEHLFIGTQRDNVQDMIRKRRHKVLRGSANPGAKLNEFKVVQIRDLYEEGGTSYAKLAREFHVSPKLIELVVKRIVWRTV